MCFLQSNIYYTVRVSCVHASFIVINIVTTCGTCNKFYLCAARALDTRLVLYFHNLTHLREQSNISLSKWDHIYCRIVIVKHDDLTMQQKHVSWHYSTSLEVSLVLLPVEEAMLCPISCMKRKKPLKMMSGDFKISTCSAFIHSWKNEHRN